MDSFFDSDKFTDKIVGFIKTHLKPSRLEHTYGVSEEAAKLAEHYGEDPEKARTAALFHDMFRSTVVSMLDAYADEFGLPAELKNNPNLAHGKIAAAVLKRDYGVADEDFLNAVAYHTTGREGMSKLEKIIFLADAVEPGRNYPSVEEARRLAYEDLNRACLNVLENTVEYIKGKGEYLDPDTLRARDDLKEKLGL